LSLINDLHIEFDKRSTYWVW